VQKLWVSPTRRVLDLDVGARTEKSELIPTLEEPGKNAGRLSRSAVLKPALERPAGGHNLRDAEQLDNATNHIRRIRPSTRITKRV